MYHQNNNFHEALQCFTQVFEDEKENPDLFIKRGNVYLDMGNYQFAIDDFDQAINMEESIQGLFLRGTSKLRSKDYVGAENDFNRAIILEGLTEYQKAGINDGLGQVSFQLKKYDEALPSFNEALNTVEDNVQYYMNRADCFYRMAQYQDAIDDFNAALDINPEEDNPQVLYKMGLTYYAFGKYRRCVKTLKRALQAGPYITYQADIYYHVGLAFC